MKEEQLDFVTLVLEFRKELLKSIGDSPCPSISTFASRSALFSLNEFEGWFSYITDPIDYADLHNLITALIDLKLLNAAFFNEVIFQGECYFDDCEVRGLDIAKGVPLLQMIVRRTCQNDRDYRRASDAVEAVYEAAGKKVVLV